MVNPLKLDESKSTMQPTSETGCVASEIVAARSSWIWQSSRRKQTEQGKGQGAATYKRALPPELYLK
jgi:hypothetical protein